MTVDDIIAAIGEAQGVLRRADNMAAKFAHLLVGRVRKVDDGYLLAQLKRELNDFDARSKRWKR